MQANKYVLFPACEIFSFYITIALMIFISGASQPPVVVSDRGLHPGLDNTLSAASFMRSRTHALRPALLLLLDVGSRRMQP